MLLLTVATLWLLLLVNVQDFIFLMSFASACLAVLVAAAVICTLARSYTHPSLADVHMQQLRHRAPVYSPYIERGTTMAAAAASRPGKGEAASL